MSIKFQCPLCHKALSVRDEMAGKKGTCPGCKKVLIVPAAVAAPKTNGLAAKGPATKPTPRPKDVEAEAAAILRDKPPEPAPEAAAKTIDFNCPMCDEPLQVSLDLAGKNTPCASCRRIIKVPQVKKQEPIDWKKPNAGLPSLARQDVPAVAGVWDNKEAVRVSQEALEEAGALPELREPLTVAQKVQRWLLAGAAVAFLVAGASFVSHRATEERETDSLNHALGYGRTELAGQQLAPEGRAELQRLFGLYYLRTNRDNCGLEAQKHFNTAFGLLRDSQGLEHDLALAELALAWLELGGSGDDVEEGRRLAWAGSKNAAPVWKMVEVTLGAIGNRELRLEALRPVLCRIIAVGEAGHVYVVANHVFGTASGSSAERLFSMEAQARAGVELLVAGQSAEAARVADLLQQQYAQANQPPLAPSAVALMLALSRPELKIVKATDEDNAEAGKAEGYARLDQPAKGRELIAKAHPQLQFQSRLNMAAAALDLKKTDGTDLDHAFQSVASFRDAPATRWLQWRLLQLGLRANVAEDRLKPVVEALPDLELRSRGQLAILEARLAKSVQAEPDDILETVPEKTLARALAHAALARHNIRHDKATAQKALQWPQPYSAFGSLGVALGMQRE